MSTISTRLGVPLPSTTRPVRHGWTCGSSGRIGSGDGYFADLAIWPADRGLHVAALSRRTCLSWRLYTAVPDIVTFELPVARAA
ncbi:MAG: hypothetical protein IRY84_15425 [Thermobispora bispora]|nr:hypothetical protein [Thermobispora bispora]